MNSLSVILAILISSTFLVNPTFAKCHLKELDFCSASLMMQLQNQETPITETSIDTYCKTIGDAYDCVGNFTQKCATPLQRDLIDFVTVGGVNAVKEFCTPGSPMRSKYLANAKCLAEARKEAKRCSSDLQASIEELTTTYWENRIPLGCCAFNRFQECSLSIVKSRCGLDVVDLGRRVMSMATSRIPETVCRSFPTKSPLCVNILPATGETPKGNKSPSLIARLLATFMGN